MKKLILLFVCIWACSLPQSFAQKKKKKAPSAQAFDSEFFKAVEWRQLGPFRGGRSCTVTGVKDDPDLYYFGSAGGGVWRSKDAGESWHNISDGFFGGSIGAIAVSDADPNVIYAGGGEQTLRGNVSSGNGIWRSEDAGKTWKHMGLKQSRHVSRIRIHPNNPDVVYVAAIGDIYRGHPQRGIFRSKDGGKNWEKVLFVNDDVGAADLCFEPGNPRILYASTWRVRRTPYDMSSGGQGSGIWKSTDSGDSWEELSTNEGLPKDTLGIIGLAVSPVKKDRVWAMIESKEGGLFRSDDGGKTWKKQNSERNLRQRAWYYTRVYADPQDADVVYVLNVLYHRSNDGGKTFKSFRSPHSDHHDLWIDPSNSQRMIIGDDGGAQVSNNGGKTWTTYHNQPTAQFYRVSTDDSFPYRIYAAQQDNSTVRLKHRSAGSSISDRDWESTAGCECGHIAADPLNNDIVYGGCYDGYLSRLDHETGQGRAVSVWPDNPMGHGAEGMRYRFQWNFPLFFSPHNPKKLYTCSNYVHTSTDGGQSWEIISPDLTRNDSSKLVSSGGPITKDNTSVEYYCTIFAAAESSLKEGVLWAGSDDGLLHVSEDAGKNWHNVTPSGMPKWCLINSIEPDPFDAAGLYVAATMYKSGDYKPYLFRTKDYGKTWQRINKGIAEEHFTRVIRCDQKVKGLLYCGTEAGMYISFDDGANWSPFQLNLPVVPITDLVWKNNNLIAATQGRSLWMIDDLGPFQQYKTSMRDAALTLFKPLPAYRMSGHQNKNNKKAGLNHPGGVMNYFYLAELADSAEVKLSFLEADGTVIKSFSNKAKEKQDQLKVSKGSNSFVWNMYYAPAEKFDGMILWWGSLRGPKAKPGQYKVRLEYDSLKQEQNFEILADPRLKLEPEDFATQFDFVNKINNTITEAHTAIDQIKDVRKQLTTYKERIAKFDEIEEIVTAADKIDSTLTKIEETLYQTKNQSPQDPLNFPIRLTNKLAHLNSLAQNGDGPPTSQMMAVREELTAKIDEELSRFKTVISTDLKALNKLIHAKAIDTIIIKEKKEK